MPSKTTKIDVAILDEAYDRGFENKYLAYLGSPKARNLRSDDLTFVFQKKCFDAINSLNSLDEKIATISKELRELQHISFPLFLINGKNTKKDKIANKEYRFRAHLTLIINLKIRYLLQYLSFLEKMKREWRERILDFYFILEMEKERRFDDQVTRFSHMEGADFAIQLSVLAGAKDALSGKSKQRTRKKEGIVDE